MPDDHYPLLAKVCVTKNITKDEVDQLMLLNTLVLAYKGLDRWNYNNPAVQQSELFKVALQDCSPPMSEPMSCNNSYLWSKLLQNKPLQNKIF